MFKRRINMKTKTAKPVKMAKKVAKKTAKKAAKKAY